jgi:hypothetical protein
MTAVPILAASDLRRLRRSRALLVVLGAGVVTAATVTAVAAPKSGLDEADAFRGGAASLYLIGGLVLALVLGCTASFVGAISGHHGLLVASGARRRDLAIGVLASRVGVFLAGLILWLIALQSGSLAIGRGLDGPLAVHAAAAALTSGMVLLVTAATSTVLGPAIAVIVGLVVSVSATAIVNLEQAADVGRIASTPTVRLVHVAYNLLPRTINSSMIVELQNRGTGGPAAPRFEINQIPIPLNPSSWTTVLWTLGWCALFAWLFVIGVRRRTLQ